MVKSVMIIAQCLTEKAQLCLSHVLYHWATLSSSISRMQARTKEEGGGESGGPFGMGLLQANIFNKQFEISPTFHIWLGPVTSFVWAYYQLCMGLLPALYGPVTSFVWACYQLCMGLLPALYGPVTSFVWACYQLCLGLLPALHGPVISVVWAYIHAPIIYFG